MSLVSLEFLNPKPMSHIRMYYYKQFRWLSVALSLSIFVAFSLSLSLSLSVCVCVYWFAPTSGPADFFFPLSVRFYSFTQKMFVFLSWRNICTKCARTTGFPSPSNIWYIRTYIHVYTYIYTHTYINIHIHIHAHEMRKHHWVSLSIQYLVYTYMCIYV